MSTNVRLEDKGAQWALVGIELLSTVAYLVFLWVALGIIRQIGGGYGDGGPDDDPCPCDDPPTVVVVPDDVSSLDGEKDEA